MHTKQRDELGNETFNKIPVSYVLSIIATAIIVAALIFGGLFLKENFFTRDIDSDSETQKIGFEDIGKLVTQSAYCKEVNTTDSAKSLFGFTLPFTQSTYIYSYSVEIQAGYDFSAIIWSVEDTTIKVTLPEPEVISCAIDYDSFQVYYEKESIFNDITLDENNEAMQGLRESAQENAIANGLFDNAEENAKKILEAFFSNEYDLNEYELVFAD